MSWIMRHRNLLFGGVFPCILGMLFVLMFVSLSLLFVPDLFRQCNCAEIHNQDEHAEPQYHHHQRQRFWMLGTGNQGASK